MSDEQNKTTHTPGPWKVVEEDLRGGKYWSVVWERGEQDHPYVVDGIHEEDNGEANARLIAAAPNLLAELRRMVDHFGAWAADRSMDATPETWAALHCARDAIAKAEGSST